MCTPRPLIFVVNFCSSFLVVGVWAEMQFNSQFRDDVSGVQQFLNASATNSTADGSDGTLGFIEDFEVTRYWLGIYGPIISGLNLILFPYHK